MGLGPAAISFTVLDPEKIPQAHHPRWAVLGRSNVGKSSFLNSLIHPDKLFRTGGMPGVTTGLIGVNVRLGKHEDSTLELVDMPGFGFAARGSTDRDRWIALADVLKDRSADRGIQWIWLVDPTRPPEESDLGVLSWLGRQNYTFVFTKSDKIKPSGRAGIERAWKAISDLASEGPYWVSSMKGEGMQELFKSARVFVRGSAI
jgi:GTP-binding protein